MKRKRVEKDNILEMVSDVYKGLISIRTDNNLQFPGCCTWKGYCYEIMLSPKFCEVIGVPIQDVLRHEIMHILRGDLEAGIRPADIDPALYNYASDAIINSELHITHSSAITLDRVGWDEGYIPGVIELCEYLRDQMPEDYNMDVIMPKEMTGEEASEMRKARAKAVIETVKNAGKSDILSGIKGIVSKDMESGIYAGKEKGSLTIGLPKPSPLVELCRYLQKNGYHRGKERIIKKRFRDRNSGDLIFKYPVPLPSLKVGVVVDVSGSMTGYYQRILAVARWLFEKYKGVFITFSDEAKAYKNLPSSIEDAGGGTRLIEINPYVWDLDTLVIFSDFYLDSDGSDKMIAEFQKRSGKVIAVTVGRDPKWKGAIVYRLEEDK